jgi:hypothetical protein
MSGSLGNSNVIGAVLMRLPGDAKTRDAANFGLFKVNWGMLRVCASRAGFKGQSEDQWNNGAKLK